MAQRRPLTHLNLAECALLCGRSRSYILSAAKRGALPYVTKPRRGSKSATWSFRAVDVIEHRAALAERPGARRPTAAQTLSRKIGLALAGAS